MANIENSVLKLKQHQIEAYDNVKKLLDEIGKAAVEFPTGCGKSFVTLQYIQEHPDDRILFLSPRRAIGTQMYEYIVRQIGGLKREEYSIEDIKKQYCNVEKAAKAFIPNIEALQYQTILNIGNGGWVDRLLSKLNPDLIVIDEMHHLKTKSSNSSIIEDEDSLTEEEQQKKIREENEWGKKFQELLDRFPNAKLLGLSATPKRTDGANVVERIFDNAYAAKISLLEAIEDEIIMPPKYVVPDFITEDQKETMLKKISRKTGKDRKKAQEEYNDLVKKSDETSGIPELMEEHITEKNGKYIVFCKNIKDMKEKIAQSKEWFGKIDAEPTIYRVSSKHKDSDKQLEDFNNDESEHLKVMYCVGMIDEGVHLKGVSGVVLAAKTGSRPTYFQRLGRAISSGDDKKQATVIDLVNNYEILYNSKEREVAEFSITDLESLLNAKKWIEESNNGEYPKCIDGKSKKEKRLAKRLVRLQNKYKKFIDHIDKLEKSGNQIKDIEEIISVGHEMNLWNTEIEIDDDIRARISDIGFLDNIEIKGARKKFENILKKMDGNKTQSTEIICICENLIEQGVDLKKIDTVKKIEENGKLLRKSTTLRDIKEQYPDIDIDTILLDFDIELDYPLGRELVHLKTYVNNKSCGNDKISDEERQKVIELNIVEARKSTRNKSFNGLARVAEKSEHEKNKEAGRVLENMTKKQISKIK